MASRSFVTLPYFVIDACAWLANRKELIDRIADRDLGPTVVIRSCAEQEDVHAYEPPGFFESVLDVAVEDHAALAAAISRVIASYDRRRGDQALRHKVIVQTQLLYPELCGVCHVGDTEGGYIEVDYDDRLQRTDAVTAGLRAQRVTLAPCLAMLPAPWRAVRVAADQIARRFPRPFFVEFAIDRRGVVVVFQVRPDRRPSSATLRTPPRAPSCSELRKIGAQVARTGPLSVMADWNPAEILGFSPMPLDISLYDELLMRGAWADGRASAGWQRPDEPALMTVLCGRPYIKLVTSIKTLFPVGLSPELTRRLVRDRLVFLSSNRALHDKIEFRVVWSAFAFDEAKTANSLRVRGFEEIEIKELFDALKEVTRHALATAPASGAADLESSTALDVERFCLTAHDWATPPPSAADKIRTGLSVCRTFGTVPFSRQARLAFMFRYMITYLVESGSVAAADVEQWQTNLNTVTRRLTNDTRRLRAEELSAAAFNRTYGHLRPGTYNLESLRYDEQDFPSANHAPDPLSPSFGAGPPPSSVGLAALLKTVGSARSQGDFWDAAAGAYRAREELKFRFSAFLSDLLRVLADFGKHAGLDRSDMRKLTISELLAYMDHARSWDAFGTAARKAISAWDRRDAPREFLLPDVIFDPADLAAVVQTESQPTFVGSAVVEARPFALSVNARMAEVDLTGTIVVIQAPDPGYDWIFSERVAGLMTEFGGEFSHMGLRCSEFEIPAALGCGREVFNAAAQADRIRLDGAEREIWADGRRLCPR